MMKLVFLLAMLICSNVYAGNQWQEGTGQNTLLGSISPSDIDKDSFENAIDPLDRLLTDYQDGCDISYASAATLTVASGEVVIANSAGTIKLFQQNTSATTVAWTAIDTGAEETSTTYYLYSYQATVTDTDFDVAISKSSSTPSGITYFTRLGSFYNNADGDIEQITNDNNYYALKLGDWLSRSAGTTYLASTDGFAIVVGSSGVNQSISAYTDSVSTPTTVMGHIRYINASDSNNSSQICMPVKDGDYWRVIVTSGAVSAVYWIPNE